MNTKELAETLIKTMKTQSHEQRVEMLSDFLENYHKHLYATMPQELRQVEDTLQRLRADLKWNHEMFVPKWAVIEAIRKWWIKHPDIEELVTELHLNSGVMLRKDAECMVVKMLKDGRIASTVFKSMAEAYGITIEQFKTEDFNKEAKEYFEKMYKNFDPTEISKEVRTYYEKLGDKHEKENI